MQYKADYGLHVLQSGHASKEIKFPSFQIDHIHVIDTETMSITTTVSSNGEQFAATLDIPHSLVRDFFAEAPAAVRQILVQACQGRLRMGSSALLVNQSPTGGECATTCPQGARTAFNFWQVHG
jgi:hypothetical protein